MSNTTISQSGSLEPTKVVIYTKLTPRQAALVTSWRVSASNLGPRRLEDYRCRMGNDASRTRGDWMNPSRQLHWCARSRSPTCCHSSQKYPVQTLDILLRKTKQVFIASKYGVRPSICDTAGKFGQRNSADPGE